MNTTEIPVISSYTSEQVIEDGVLVAVTKKDLVTRAVWDWLVEKTPMTAQPPSCWPVEMMSWFRAGEVTKKNPQDEQKVRDNKARALASGLIGSESKTAIRVYEAGDIYKIHVEESATTIRGVVKTESGRELWLMPNEVGGVTLMFPSDY
jgi:hypothetical protein